MTSKKKFYSISLDDSQVSELISKTPRDAALKVTTEDLNRIYIVEGLEDKTKVHIFNGVKEKLSANKQNQFTLSKNINFKSKVAKIGTICIPKLFCLRQAENLSDLQKYVKDEL